LLSIALSRPVRPCGASFSKPVLFRLTAALRRQAEALGEVIGPYAAALVDSPAGDISRDILSIWNENRSERTKNDENRRKRQILQDQRVNRQSPEI
jgi:hypothetical protein